MYHSCPKRVVIVGKAGSGKDYLRDYLADCGLFVDVSVTTRPKREGELPGHTYHYIDKEEYNRLVENNMLYEHVTFNGWGYGTTLKSWDMSSVFIMTPTGVSKIAQCDRKDCWVLYLDIPEDIRRERISLRSDADSVDRRLEADRIDFNGFADYDYRVVDGLFDKEVLGDKIFEVLGI